MGLWLGAKVNEQMRADRLALIDPGTGQGIGDYTAVSRRLEAAETEARVAKRREQAAMKRAEAERERAAAEAPARAPAEEPLPQVEAELRRLCGEGERPARSRGAATHGD
jgi:hypothetical protein